MNWTIISLLHEAQKWYTPKKFQHALRVAEYAAANAKHDILVREEDAYIVGLAHDLLEDTEMPFDTLKKTIDSQSLMDAILLLTKPEGEDYQVYIDRIIKSENALAILVKRADMKDHLTLMDTLTDKLKEKYLPVLHYFL